VGLKLDFGFKLWSTPLRTVDIPKFLFCGLFNDAVTILGSTASNGRMISEECCGYDLEERGRPRFAWTDRGKPRRTSFRISGVSYKIREELLPNISPERYRCANLLPLSELKSVNSQYQRTSVEPASIFSCSYVGNTFATMFCSDGKRVAT
jgi:hypothetical protein